MTPHDSVSERPKGNVTPWISVDVVDAQFPIRVRFLNWTELSEDHYLSPDEAIALVDALYGSIFEVTSKSERRPGSKT